MFTRRYRNDASFKPTQVKDDPWIWQDGPAQYRSEKVKQEGGVVETQHSVMGNYDEK